MAGRIFPEGVDRRTYCGLYSIYEYINGDGKFRKFNCGQAAACTFLTHHRIFQADLPTDEAREVMRGLEANHPPDNLGGWLGTSRRRVERACRAAGISIEPVEGEDDLRKHLNDLQPVMVMCAVDGPKLLGRWAMPSGHWMVAYGFDERQIFLSNWSEPSMSWPEFRKCWGALIPRLLSLQNTGIAAVSQLVDSPKPYHEYVQSSAIV